MEKEKLKKWIIIGSIGFMLIISMIASYSSCNKNTSKNSTDIIEDTVAYPQLVMKITQCSKLYTSEYQIHKIITNDDAMLVEGSFFARKFNLKVPFADRKIAIPMDATLKAYIDFSGFTEKNIEKEGKKIIVTLPDPKVEVTSSKVDYAHIKEYLSVTRSHYTDEEQANFTKQGLVSIINHIPQMGIIEQSRENAARILIPIIQRMGYKEENIVINFRKHFTMEDLPTIVSGNWE